MSAGEVKKRHVTPGERADEGSDCGLAWVEETREFMDVVWGVSCV